VPKTAIAVAALSRDTAPLTTTSSVERSTPMIDAAAARAAPRARRAGAARAARHLRRSRSRSRCNWRGRSALRATRHVGSDRGRQTVRRSPGRPSAGCCTARSRCCASSTPAARPRASTSIPRRACSCA
jgi:hypothetical protein